MRSYSTPPDGCEGVDDTSNCRNFAKEKKFIKLLCWDLASKYIQYIKVLLLFYVLVYIQSNIKTYMHGSIFSYGSSTIIYHLTLKIDTNPECLWFCESISPSF